MCAGLVSWPMASLCRRDNSLMVIMEVMREWAISPSYLLNDLDMSQGHNVGTSHPH